MEKFYGYINSINVLSSLSLALLWASKLAGWDILSGTIVNNYIALTAVYAPGILFAVQAVIMVAVKLNKRHLEYYQQATALFSFVNLAVYLLYLAYLKFF